MLQWVFYVLVVSAVLSMAGVLAEQALRRGHLPTRSIWLITLAMSVALSLHAVSTPPKRAAASAGHQSTSVLQPIAPIRLPDVSATVLKDTHAEGLLRIEVSMRAIWLGLSALVLVGLIASALQVYLRRRRWPMRLVESHCVGVSENVGPAVIGLIRPTIVLPEWVLTRTPGERQLIVAHEASHLAARDPLALTLALLAVLLLPWNPFLWWQLHRLRHAIEVDCDARVLRAGHDPITYGEALIEVGQRGSRYLGTVAAMSENRTLLEKRIELMSLRTKTPWKIGFAALSALSLSVALAATQVATPDAAGTAELTLDTATLNRYVGHYQVGSTSSLTIVREGAQLTAKMTGQPAFPIYADSPTEFHWKVVPARVTFSGDINGLASTATIHQNGADIAAARIDDNLAAQREQQLADRIAAHQAQPGTEASLRKTIAALVAGKPNFADMSDPLQAVVRQQQPATEGYYSKLGPVQTVEFRGVSEGGADKYLVTHTGGSQSQWLIQLGSDGRIATLAVLPVF